MLRNWLHFPQETGVHVENKPAHGDVLGNPGMRPDFLNLLPCIYLKVLMTHRFALRANRAAGLVFYCVVRPANRERCGGHVRAFGECREHNKTENAPSFERAPRPHRTS